MKILVKRERLDPFVSSEEKPPAEAFHGVSLEQDLNAEVELLRGRDLLEKIVVSLRLHEPANESKLAILRRRLVEALGSSSSKEKRIAKAVLNLERKLSVEPLQKSNMIQVSYRSSDPEQSTRILNTLAELYLEKHLAVHRPPGTFSFFQQAAERYRNQLSQSESRLAQFVQEEGVVSPELQKEIAARKLADFEASLEETSGAIKGAKERFRILQAQAQSTLPRMTTTLKTSTGQHFEQLQQTLANLELKKIELLRMFQPSYPLVVEVESQIAAAQASIKAAEQSPQVEETTDRDPTFEWIRSELAKAETELAALESRAEATTQTIAAYRNKAIRLDQLDLIRRDLVRDNTLVEQNYQIHFRKQEEARISDELDRQRIVNVSIAEPATVPYLSVDLPRWQIAFLGGVAAILLSGLLALVFDRWDPSFRTPHELEEFLDVPVAAAIPKVGR